jgi:hypothetical protein
LCSNQYGTLIALEPKDSLAIYLDSGSHQKYKDYKLIKDVLDDALTGYSYREGIIKRKNQRRGKYTFIHKTDFACIKQAPGSTREAWYAIYHMREYVKDEQRLQYLSSLAKWCGTLAGSSDAEVRQEFGRIQQMIARTISRDVIHSDGVFFYSHRPLPNADIEARLHQHGDDRPFNSLQGYLPFPPLKPKPKSKPKPSKK